MTAALMFSGQGSQHSKMGLELYDNYSCCREVFEKINEVLKFNLTDILFNEDERINNVKYSQVCIFAVGAAAYSLIKKEIGIKTSYFLGLSSGEYGAIYGSGAFSLEDTVKLLLKRGEFMLEASQEKRGGMLAVLGLSKEEVIEICNEANSQGYITPCNYNMPKQIVIGGAEEGIQRAIELISIKNKKGRAIKLNVGGAFHTKFMEPARIRLQIELDKVEIKEMNTPVVSNLTAKPIKDRNEIPGTLLNQLISPVLFEDSIKYLINENIHTFIELGPSNVLSSIVKKIDKNVKVFSVSDKQSYENLIEDIGGD